MVSVEQLCRDVLARHRIPPHRVVGHSDIAPDRKSDPGELFDWPRLARAGIGIWPPADPLALSCEIDRSLAFEHLHAIGYCARLGSEAAALIAFQRRFRPACCDGRLDAETAGRLTEVRAAFSRSRAGLYV